MDENEATVKPVTPRDCIGGNWQRQGRVDKNSPDYSEFAEFMRSIVIAAKHAPVYTLMQVSGQQFVLLGSRASRGTKGSTAIILALFDSNGDVGKQRYFLDWSQDSGGMNVENMRFSTFEEWKVIREKIKKLNFGPVPEGKGTNDEWKNAIERGEFLPISEYQPD